MLILRPAAEGDLDDLVALADRLDSMNLPNDREFLAARIELSLRSFAGSLEDCASGVYVFVLEDTEARRCIGTSLIIAKTGVPGAPYYWFECSTEERHSVELGKRFVHTKLRLRSTEDGPSEIGGIILDPEYRGHPQKCGKALSIVRFAYMSLHLRAFQREVIAEMLSPFEESGENLLWEAFGARFTGLPYREADHLSARNKQFIADLFPRDPVYTTLFPEKVQAIIGKPNASAVAALKILEKVGFGPLNQVDPFDGGPYYGAARDAISSVRERRELVLSGTSSDSAEDLSGPLALLSTESRPGVRSSEAASGSTSGPTSGSTSGTTTGFRATVVPLDQDGAPLVDKRCREALGIDAGDRVSITPLP